MSCTDGRHADDLYCPFVWWDQIIWPCLKTEDAVAVSVKCLYPLSLHPWWGSCNIDIPRCKFIRCSPLNELNWTCNSRKILIKIKRNTAAIINILKKKNKNLEMIFWNDSGRRHHSPSHVFCKSPCVSGLCSPVGFTKTPELLNSALVSWLNEIGCWVILSPLPIPGKKTMKKESFQLENAGGLTAALQSS